MVQSGRVIAIRDIKRDLISVVKKNDRKLVVHENMVKKFSLTMNRKGFYF